MKVRTSGRRWQGAYQHPSQEHGPPWLRSEVAIPALQGGDCHISHLTHATRSHSHADIQDQCGSDSVVESG